jgi:hypothetical protein
MVRPLAATVDLVCVLVFALVGRRSHAEGSDLLGVLETAWPFLTGAVVGLIAVRAWRGAESLRAGVVVWLGTVVLGVGLRLVSGDTAQPAFVLVTTLTLGVLLLGWRSLLSLVRRARTRDRRSLV